MMMMRWLLLLLMLCSSVQGKAAADKGLQSLELSKQLSILSKRSDFDVNNNNNNNSSIVDPTRWAIVALTRPTDININTRNANLKNYLRKIKASNHNITLLFFSEFKVKQRTKDLWLKIFKGIATIRIINTFDDGFDSDDRYGYKYVCRFFSVSIFKYLQADYDYYLRLDGDVYIKKLDYDIFTWAKNNDADYVFGTRKIESHGLTRQTLPQWVMNYTKLNNVTPSCDMNESLAFCFNFYNNFHIGKVAFFTSPQVTHFLNAVVDTNAIERLRWGDSTIHAYAVRLFSQPHKLFQVENFTYIHGSHGLVIVSNGHDIESTVPNQLPPWRFEVIESTKPSHQHPSNLIETTIMETTNKRSENRDSQRERELFLLATFLLFFIIFMIWLKNE